MSGDVRSRYLNILFHPSARYGLGSIAGEIFYVGSILSHPPVRLGAIPIAAEIFNVDSDGQHMFTYNIHEAAGPSRRPCSTHLCRPSAIGAEYRLFLCVLTHPWSSDHVRRFPLEFSFSD